MPCDSGIGWTASDYEARQKADAATRVACDILGALEAAGISTEGFSVETKAWWEKHKRQDALRREREQVTKQREELRKSAMLKLTPAEQAALGIVPR